MVQSPLVTGWCQPGMALTWVGRENTIAGGKSYICLFINGFLVHWKLGLIRILHSPLLYSAYSQWSCTFLVIFAISWHINDLCSWSFSHLLLRPHHANSVFQDFLQENHKKQVLSTFKYFSSAIKLVLTITCLVQDEQHNQYILLQMKPKYKQNEHFQGY